MPSHNEAAFETAIETHLLSQGGYIKGNPSDFSRETALHINTVLSFIQESQPKEWEKLSKIHGAATEDKFLSRLCKELDNRGTLDVLRKGITDHGVNFKLAYFKPVSGLNPETEKLYNLNRLTVTRQVQYSTKNKNSIDMVLSINGFPVATVELKNQFTGQSVLNSINQYKYDRNPKELIFQFKKRAIVHFAVDTDEVYMTTRLAGKDTKFLRFLIKKLPRRNIEEEFKLHDEVALEYYRLQKMAEGDITIEQDGAGLSTVTEAGMRKEKEEKSPLSEIIDILNERFGTDFTDADRLYFQQIEEVLTEDDKLVQQAKNNTIDNFKYGFEDVFMSKIIERMEQNEEIFKKIIDDEKFRGMVQELIMRSVYKKLNRGVK